MALILPIFLLICLGILDFGRAFYSYERIQNAAREGAAWLAARPTASQAAVEARVRSEGVPCDGGAIQVTGAAVVDDSAIVTVTCGFDLVTPFFAAVIGTAPPCNTIVGIRLCQPTQRLNLTGRAQMPLIPSGT
jgi:Flp pilus assembly protein TadG